MSTEMINARRQAKLCWWLMALLFLTGMIGLIVPYCFYVSDAWSSTFDKLRNNHEVHTGLIIESIRLLVFCLLIPAVVNATYGPEFRDVLSFHGRHWVQITGRAILFGSFLFLTFKLWGHHFGVDPSAGPPKLVQIYQDAHKSDGPLSEEQIAQIRLQYRWYFFYSLAIYSVITSLLISIPAVAFARDYRQLSAARSDIASADDGEPRIARFLQFRLEAERCAVKHLPLAGFLLLLYIYEAVLGRWTSLDVASEKVLMGYVVVGVAIVYMGCVAVTYGQAYRQARVNLSQIAGNPEDRAKEFDERHSVHAFALSVMQSHVMGLVLVVVGPLVITGWIATAAYNYHTGLASKPDASTHERK